MAGEDEVSLQFLAENSTDIICRAGVDMVLHYVSPSSFHVLGWRPEEMMGKRPDAFFLPEDASVLAGSVSSGDDNSPVTVRMRMKDGTMAWVEIKRRMVCDSTTGVPRETVIIMRDITVRKELQEKLSLLELTDSRTGLSTPRAFDEALQREWNRSLREGSHISLLLLDFHHFRQFHDGREHLEGDLCLGKAAAAVIGALRVTDFAAHYGAEEIAIILPSTGPRGAAKVAAKVRSAVETLRSPHHEKVDDRDWVIVSIGISTVLARAGATQKMPEILLLAADSALYKATESHGRGSAHDSRRKRSLAINPGPRTEGPCEAEQAAEKH
jgi:diguanylate cyclase (GGDEF)-like protein/PAS domain S-box-containing protein